MIVELYKFLCTMAVSNIMSIRGMDAVSPLTKCVLFILLRRGVLSLSKWG